MYVQHIRSQKAKHCLEQDYFTLHNIYNTVAALSQYLLDANVESES